MHLACAYDGIEIVKLIIQASKDFDFDLKATNNVFGKTIWHYASKNGRIEIDKLIIHTFTLNKKYVHVCRIKTTILVSVGSLTFKDLKNIFSLIFPDQI